MKPRFNIVKAIAGFVFGLVLSSAFFAAAQMGVSGPILGPMPAGTVSSAAFPLRGPADAVGAPNYSWASAPTTGMFSSGGAVGFSIGGVAKLQIDGTGTLFNQNAYWIGEAAHVFATRNGTNAQTVRIYNTFTDASNFERIDIGFNGSTPTIAHGSSGTGVARQMAFNGNGYDFRTGGGGLAGGTSRWTMDTSGNLSAQANQNINLGGGSVLSGSFFQPTSAVTKFNIRGNGTTPVQIAVTQTTAPTITTNGGTSPACVGSDTAMTCTEGTAPPAAATFTVTFNGTWASAPACVAMRGTAGATPLVQNVVTGTTTVQVNLSANLVASEKFHILCMGVS